MPFFPDLPKSIRYLELASRIFVLFFFIGVLVVLLSSCEFYLFYGLVTKYTWVLPLFLAIFFELISIYLQKRKGLYPEFYFVRFAKFLAFFLLLTLLLNIFTLGSRGSILRSRDKQIENYFSRAEKLMEDLYAKEGDYDNFSCQNENLQEVCFNIDRFYTRPPLAGVICRQVYSVDQKEPFIARDSASSSQAVCMYSPLNQAGNLWYCLDSEGTKGRVQKDPSSPGHCIDGESATCPEY